MDFKIIVNCYIKNIPKMLVSLMVNLIPCLIVYYLIIETIYMPIGWQVYLLIVQIYLLDHFYMLTAKCARGEEIGWYNGFKTNNYRKILGIMLIVYLIKTYIPFIYASVMKETVLCYIIGGMLEFLIFLFVYTLYMSFIAYSVNDKYPFLKGIKDSLIIGKRNLIFYFLSAIILYPITIIPYIGVIIGMIAFMFIELIRTYLYIGIKSDELGQEKDYEEYY